MLIYKILCIIIMAYVCILQTYWVIMDDEKTSIISYIINLILLLYIILSHAK
jgi:hypothetical protein